jgi:hypothetical protein
LPDGARGDPVNHGVLLSPAHRAARQGARGDPVNHGVLLDAPVSMAMFDCGGLLYIHISS